MTPTERKGLQRVKNLVREYLLDRGKQHSIEGIESTEQLNAALRWIAHQEKIDDQRRRPRKP